MLFKLGSTGHWGTLPRWQQERWLEGSPGPLQSQRSIFTSSSWGMEEFLSKRPFLSHPLKNHNKEAPVHCTAVGNSWVMGSLHAAPQGHGPLSGFYRAFIRCDFSEPSVMSKLKLHEHWSGHFVLSGPGPQPPGCCSFESQAQQCDKTESQSSQTGYMGSPGPACDLGQDTCHLCWPLRTSSVCLGGSYWLSSWMPLGDSEPNCLKK